jgi:hypothetical protein
MNTPWQATICRGMVDPASVEIFRGAQEPRFKNMRTNKMILGKLALAAGLTLAGFGCSGHEQEATLKFVDCPAIVQKTITDHAGGVVFPTIDRETKKSGRIVFEAKGKKADGNKIEIKVAADGSLVGFKIELDD